MAHDGSKGSTCLHFVAPKMGSWAPVVIYLFRNDNWDYQHGFSRVLWLDWIEDLSLVCSRGLGMITGLSFLRHLVVTDGKFDTQVLGQSAILVFLKKMVSKRALKKISRLWTPLKIGRFIGAEIFPAAGAKQGAEKSAAQPIRLTTRLSPREVDWVTTVGYGNMGYHLE